MNITRENIDNLNALLKVEVKKSDYEEKVEKALREYRKNANLKGFRPGMVPLGLIRKMYGTTVKLEEINKLVSESIGIYLVKENINILGNPIPSDNNDISSNFEMQEDFQFTFELGLVPEFEIKLSRKNKVPYYEIIIDEKLRNDYVSSYTRKYGRFINTEISGESDLLKGSLAPADDNTPESGNFRTDDTTLTTSIIKDEEIKREFSGKKAGDSIVFDIKKAFPNVNEIAGLLKIRKEQAAKVEGNYRFIISEISRFEPAEIGKELFDQIYGDNAITTKEEFYTKIDEEISANLANESNYKLALDLKELASEKTKFELPEKFLKKWLLRENKEATEEQIEKEFNSFIKDLKWQLILKKIAKDNDIKITDEEVLREAEKLTRYQFLQYGLFYATDEQITSYAREMVERENDARRIADRLLEKKVIEQLKGIVTLETQKVTIDEFNRLFK
ncbi:MAG: trigger factor [Bacteroidales bacterium]